MARRRGYLPALLAANVNRLNGEKGIEADIVRKTGIGAGSAHRIKHGQNVNLDTLQQVADGYKLEAWELLTPGLDPDRPPKKQISELQLEIEILRQQLGSIRKAVQQNELPAPPGKSPGDRQPKHGNAGNHPDNLETPGTKPKGR